MDVSPIQRLAAVAVHATRPPEPSVPRVRPAAAPAAPSAQANAPAADQDSTRRQPDTPPTRVVVAWHPASLGYVTRVVDQHTGTVLVQTPPEQVLAMVEQVIQQLEGENE